MAESRNFVEVCAVHELPVGSQKIVLREDQHAVALFHLKDGVYALENRCIHRGASLGEGTVNDGQVTCPMHEWIFDIRTGICRDNVEARQRSYPVRVKNGKVELNLEVGG